MSNDKAPKRGKPMHPTDSLTKKTDYVNCPWTVTHGGHLVTCHQPPDGSADAWQYDDQGFVSRCSSSSKFKPGNGAFKNQEVFAFFFVLFDSAVSVVPSIEGAQKQTVLYKNFFCNSRKLHTADELAEAHQEKPGNAKYFNGRTTASLGTFDFCAF